MANYKKISDRIEELKIDNPAAAGDLKWVNIVRAGKDEINYLRRNYSFDVSHLKVAAASISFQRPMIFEGADYLCLVMHFPAFSGDKIIAAEVDFYVGRGFLITSDNNNLKPLADLFSLGRKSPGSLLSYSRESSAVLLYEILGRLMEDCFQMLDDNSVRINEIEDLIFGSQQAEAVKKILILRRNIINIRKIIQNHKNVFQKVMERENELMAKDRAGKYYLSLIEQAKRIWETLDNQKEMVEVLNSTNESLLNNRMTNIIKVLTIFSVIVFPLTLLAAIFGMNARYMPLVEEPYGFWVILAIMIACSLVMMAFFKKKRWL